MNNVLLTGSTGFIGSYLLDFLKDRYNCLGISRGTKKNNVDITNYNSLKRIEFNPDIIIHAAAFLGNNIENGFKSNVIGTFNICKYAKEKKATHIVLISSISVYDRIENEYYDIYGKTKKQSEEIAIEFCKKEGIDLTILRLSQAYDIKGVAQKNQAMLYTFISKIKKDKKICIYGKKNPLRNYIDIEYLLNVIYEVVKNGKSGIYNVINNRSHTIIEIAYMIFDIFNIRPEIELLENRNDIPSIYVPLENIYDCRGAKCLFLKDGLKKIIINGE